MKSEIKLPVSELKSALQGLAKVVSRSSTLPVLQSVRLSSNEKGVVSLQGTDLDAFLTYRFVGLQPGPRMDLLMPLEQLTKAAKSASPKDNISLVVDSKEARLRYSLAGSLVEQSVRSLPVTEWPAVPAVSGPAMELDKGFGVALKQALECCSDDPSRYVLRGACIDVKDKKCHYVVGTNGRFLFAANSFCFHLKKEVIIPDSKFLSWSDFLDEEGSSMAVKPGDDKQPTAWVKLESPRWSFITKQIDGQYPNWKQVVPATNKNRTCALLGDESITQLLAVLPRLPGESDLNSPVRLRTEGNALFVEARAKGDKEWTSIRVQDAVVKGADLRICLNRGFLVKAVRFGLKHIEIENALSPVVMWSGGKQMVIMPLRLDDTPVPPQPTNQAPNQNKEEPKTTPKPEPTNERKTMPRQTNRIEPPVSEENTNGNGKPTDLANSTIKPMVEKVDQIRETLKTLMRDLTEVGDGLKQAEKDKKATEKEIENFRASLRKIQTFSI